MQNRLILATNLVLLSFNTVFPYKNVGGKDLRRQNVGGGTLPRAYDNRYALDCSSKLTERNITICQTLILILLRG